MFERKKGCIFERKKMINFDLNPEERANIQQVVFQSMETFIENTGNLEVTTKPNLSKIQAYAQQYKFDQTADPITVINTVIEGLKKYAVHTPHPKYFGLFNPRANFLSTVADYITATFNPQLAAWSHAPYAVEIERFLIKEFGQKFGYQSDTIDGTFCTGGAESNLTAMLCALNNCFKDFAKEGVRGIAKRPIIYCSSESHHSIAKAAKTTGLGTASVVTIPVGIDLKMDTALLIEQIESDVKAGHAPMMIVGTAGTTGAGAIDDLSTIAAIAKAHQLWFHVDAAYGGAVAISSEYRKWIKGVEQSDSITLDIHKWFSVPMGTSVFLTSNKKILHQTFGVSTKYMPKDGDPEKIIDPYLHSIQWSRRFNGLKLYLPLAVFGWKGYERVIRHQIELGNALRKGLIEKGWIIKNSSKLPIVCFTHPTLDGKEGPIVQITEAIVHSGKAWLSVYPIQGQNTFRACITNFSSSLEDVAGLIDLLENHRKNKSLNFAI